MLPARRQWWRMSPHTSSVLRPTRSGLRVRRPPEARVRAPAGSSAVGSADSFRMRFANSSWRISGCETRSAGRCSTVDGRDGYVPNNPAASQSDLSSTAADEPDELEPNEAARSAIQHRAPHLYTAAKAFAVNSLPAYGLASVDGRYSPRALTRFCCPAALR